MYRAPSHRASCRQAPRPPGLVGGGGRWRRARAVAAACTLGAGAAPGQRPDPDCRCTGLVCPSPAPSGMRWSRCRPRPTCQSSCGWSGVTTPRPSSAGERQTERLSSFGAVQGGGQGFGGSTRELQAAPQGPAVLRTRSHRPSAASPPSQPPPPEQVPARCPGAARRLAGGPPLRRVGGAVAGLVAPLHSASPGCSAAAAPPHQLAAARPPPLAHRPWPCLLPIPRSRREVQAFPRQCAQFHLFPNGCQARARCSYVSARGGGARRAPRPGRANARQPRVLPAGQARSRVAWGRRRWVQHGAGQLSHALVAPLARPCTSHPRRCTPPRAAPAPFGEPNVCFSMLDDANECSACSLCERYQSGSEGGQQRGRGVRRWVERGTGSSARRNREWRQRRGRGRMSNGSTGSTSKKARASPRSQQLVPGPREGQRTAGPRAAALRTTSARAGSR